MSPGPRHFVTLMVLLLPAFLLPAQVDLCLAGWVECDICPGGAGPRTPGTDDPGPEDEACGADEGSSERTKLSCCHTEASELEAHGDECSCCSSPLASSAGSLGAASRSAPRAALSSPDASCACCVHLDKPHEEPRDQSARATVVLSLDAAPILVATLPAPALAPARVLAHRNPTPPPLSPLPLRL